MLMRWVLGLVLLGFLFLGGKGCTPKDQIGADEEKNPYLLAGRDWMSSGNAPKARKNFEQALAVNPNSALAHYELGLLNERFDRDYVSAIYHYRQAMRLREEGYPADNAKVRVESCKQELVKAELLAPVAQSMVRELERLKQENTLLHEQLESARANANLARTATNAVGSAAARRAARDQSASRSLATSERASTRPSAETNPNSAARAATHIVRPGDTLYRIARAHNLSEAQLLQANPGLNPRALSVGYRLQIPSPR